MSAPFRFKQFSVLHDRCQMKVGTDGVLLGALTDPVGAKAILDIGTGSGLIALMMAQKSSARITGIDIDGPSVLQAAENAANSPWSSRIEMIQAKVQEFAIQHPFSYDLIISNPPFFSASLKSPMDGRNRAKHDIELTFQALLMATAKLLTPAGNAWFILPLGSMDEFIQLGINYGLHADRQIIIFPKLGKPAHRCVLRMTMGNVASLIINELVIRSADNALSPAYKRICSAFYLD